MTISLANFTKANFYFEDSADDSSGGVRRDYLYALVAEGSKAWLRIALMEYPANPSKNHSAVIVSDGNGSIAISNVMQPLFVLPTTVLAEILDTIVTRYNATEFAYNVANDLQKL